MTTAIILITQENIIKASGIFNIRWVLGNQSMHAPIKSFSIQAHHMLVVGQWSLCIISLKKESAAICLPVRLLLGHHKDAIDDVDDGDDDGGDYGGEDDDDGDDCGDDDGDESVFQ